MAESRGWVSFKPPRLPQELLFSFYSAYWRKEKHSKYAVVLHTP